ncbi:MAG: lipopolysaccharide transport periplasmic protein LptA [Candidatus Thiodiazotropha sp. (ex Myrtea sp. 'scaly one' KF741663)]|nr:lipopolysaccharide transport periplasmic protein LptA [Candidatus Thiodiazotropha sp. (ex Myrtea sp. 'scaly one' KF741663)]
MNLNKSLLYPILLIGLLFPLTLQALSGDRDQPMHLEADSVSIDEGTGISLYQGNVVITQGSLKLWADRLWIHRRDGKTDKLISEGQPTRFQQTTDEQEEVRGRALRAEFYVDRDELLLFDDALLEQGPDQFRSDRIIYNRTSSQVKAGTSADGKQRVQVIIEPRKKTAP